MSYSYLVFYEGECENPEEFLHYYIDNHLPIVWTFPCVRRVQIQRGVNGGDFFIVARFTFDTLVDLREAITSAERRRAREDMTNFPPFHGRIRYQTVEDIEIDRP